MPSISSLIIALAVLILLFFIFREVNLWYWKVNERITIGNETNKLLRELIQKTNSSSTSQPENRILNKEGVTDLNDPDVMQKLLEMYK